MPSGSCVVSRCKEVRRRLSTMLTTMELTDSEMAFCASNQAMFLQPSKLKGAGGWNINVQNELSWRSGAKGCQLATPWAVLTTWRLRCFSEFEGRWEHTCLRVVWLVDNLQFNIFAPDNQSVRLLTIMPAALLACIFPWTVTSEISIDEARILVTIYTGLLGFCSAGCRKIFPNLCNEWT
jgi:hypothetical protein